MARLLIVGGGGFIGTHTCLTLLNSNHKLVVIDNFTNSSPLALNKVCELAGISSKPQDLFQVRKGDVRDYNFLIKVFDEFKKINKPIQGVIHFAGLKSVKESIKNPLEYWDINFRGTLNLIKVMEKFQCKTLVFSSSATIYGCPENIPIPENETIKPLNPYGNTKASAEKIMADVAGCANTTKVLNYSTNGWRIARLRYFNPVGAHPSGKIGEAPNGNPDNLFPFISQVVTGKREFLEIFGNDWPTKDGTGIRDYIHIMDLAEGHCAALKYLLISEPTLLTLNLGTGTGTSVMEVVDEFEKIIDKKISYKIVNKRKGDTAIAVADVSMAKKILNWEAKRNLKQMCFDSYNWEISN